MQPAIHLNPPPIRLSGDWRVRPAPLDNLDAPPMGDWISVPECAHLQPALYPDRPYWGKHLRAINEQAWVYERVFSVPDVAYRRARLRFEGVDYFATVWVNGQFAGQHEGHFSPFNLDVTHLLHPGENTLTVRVTSPWDAPNPHGTYPTDHVIRGLVKGLYEHGEGVVPPDVNPIGIWRPVWLLLDDGLSIDHVRIRTALDGRVDLRVTLANATSETWHGSLDLRAFAEADADEVVHSPRDIRLSPGVHQIEQTLHIREPRLWWPWDQGEPNLYRLEAALANDGGAASTHRETFGVRTVRLERSSERFTYVVNERPIFVRGTSYMPSLYLSQVNRDTLARDVAFARDANLNLMRVHVHVSPPELYDLCDRAGMLVWQDFELNWVQDTSAAFEARAQALLGDMIDQLGNHPSIITWACHNEPTMVFARRQNVEHRPDPALYRQATHQDTTRPVFICSGQLEGDWRRAGDAHTYYGALWTRRYTDVYRHHYRLNTEFGFEAPAAASTLREHPDAWGSLHHLEDRIEALWGYQAELIQFHVEHFRRLRATICGGYVHFWLKDLVPQVGCGVIDSDCQKKGGYEALRLASQPLHVALEHEGRRPRALWVFNDTATRYPGTRVRWQVWGTDDALLLEGEAEFDVRANASQRVTAALWPVSPDACARVDLQLLDSEGRLLTENRYQHPFRPTLRPRGYPWKFDPSLGMKVFDHPSAPSLADHNIPRPLRAVPLTVRENATEWMLRQRFPRWLASNIARVADFLLS
ncbi:MAG: hypothetical protein KJ065_24630 [Anaerolineae bacterium]|nr:hypothetical protein [Anaerolineae bacterium]